MSFCTAINCMDGRTQLPVAEYLKRRFGAQHVDAITEPGPAKILSAEPDSELSRSIFDRVDISVHAHQSRGIAVIAHYDCAGNPTSESDQRTQLDASVALVAQKYPEAEVIGLWVDDTWSVHEVSFEPNPVDERR